MPMIRNVFPYQMDKDIDEMFMDRLMSYPSEYEKVAVQKDIPKGRYYIQAEISGLGDVAVVNEGARITFDTPVEGHRKSVEATKYGLGFQVTEEMLDDDFHGKVARVAGSLAESAKDKVNVEYFGQFEDGDDTETAWDSSYIFASHTTMKGADTLNNKGTSALSESTFQAAYQYFDGLVDEAGRKIKVEPDLLLVPRALRWTAARLQKQLGGISTSGTSPDMSGNIMTVNPEYGVIPGWTYEVIRYFDDSNNWYLINRKQHQIYLLWKKRITLESGDDFESGNRLYKVTERFVAATFDYKPVYGAFVS